MLSDGGQGEDGGEQERGFHSKLLSGRYRGFGTSKTEGRQAKPSPEVAACLPRMAELVREAARS